MFSRSLFTTLLLASSALAQSSATPAHSSAVASATGSSNPDSNPQQNAQNLVNYLLPSAATTISPSQATAIAHDAQTFLAGYTASRPLSQLEQAAVVGAILGNTQPTNEQQSSIVDLLNQAGTAAIANPSGYVQSVGDLVRPFGFAGQVTSYADGLYQGLRTVVAQELSVPVPTAAAASKTSSGGAERVWPTGAVAAAALGVAGMVLV